MKSIEYILTDIVFKAMKNKEIKNNPNSSNITYFVSKYAESEQLDLHGVVKQSGMLYCDKEEYHDYWKRGETEKECSNCGKIEAI